MNTNQIPNIAGSDPSFRGYSRYPTQAVPKLGVRYADNPSKTMVIASARNAGTPQEVNNRPKNESLKEYRIDRAPEAMNMESKELYYQAYIAHMQAMHAKDQMWFKRLCILSAVVFTLMALLIGYLCLRPTSCDSGHRFHIPILSWSSSHEKETCLQAGVSFTLLLFLAPWLLVAWQNRAFLLKYALPGVMSFVHSLKGSIQ